jgi:deoxyribonuclease V
VVVDAYVWLADDAPGLGARLHEALGEAVPVVGVAKTSFRGATRAVQLLRGTSTQPLYVTAAEMSAETAATHVASMHGAHRIPALLRRVDQLARGLAEPRSEAAPAPARRGR